MPMPMIDDERRRQRLQQMTDEEAEANARADPDNPPLTEAQLQRMHRVIDDIK
jgi:hypothetical protein